MKEAFEKIKERLEEKRSKYEELAIGSNFDGYHQEDIKYTARAEMCEEMIEIVNQVAYEYSNSEIPNKSEKVTSSEEFCEWKVDNNFGWFIKSPHERLGMIKEEIEFHRYCPYCGKEIKVVE